MESPNSEWSKLRAEFTELERIFSERTQNRTAHERAIIWASADAFADQAAMDKLHGDLRNARGSLSWAIFHAKRILAELD